MKKLLLLLVTVSLLLTLFSTPALADETVLSFCDFTLRFGDVSYSFPMTVDEAAAQGITLEKYSPLSANKYYSNLEAGDGRNDFEVRMDLVEGVHVLTGIILDSEKGHTGSIGNLELGKTTRSDVEKAFGKPYSSDGNTMTYYPFDLFHIWRLEFDGWLPWAKLTSIHATNKLPLTFGLQTKAEVPAASLPDATTMPYTQFILDGQHYAGTITVDDLLQNGWYLRLDLSPSETIEGKKSNTVRGISENMYNGAGLIEISAYNFSYSNASVSSCHIDSVEVDGSWNVSLILPGNITFGSTQSEVEKAFGKHTNKSKSGDTDEFTYKPYQDIEYIIRYTDKKVSYIKIDELK